MGLLDNNPQAISDASLFAYLSGGNIENAKKALENGANANARDSPH